MAVTDRSTTPHANDEDQDLGPGTAFASFGGA